MANGLMSAENVENSLGTTTDWQDRIWHKMSHKANK